MKETMLRKDGTVAGWMVDDLFAPNKTLADAAHYLEPRPAVKNGIGKEVPLTPVDRNDADLLDWIRQPHILPSFNYDPRNPDDPFVSLMVALWQQSIDDEFSGELVMHKRRWNLTALTMADFETVAAKFLRFVCPQATCRQVGRVGDAFKRESRPDGWNLLTCQLCGYRGYGRSLTDLQFMPDKPAIGTPDQIAQKQSEVLRSVLTVEQAAAKRRAENQQATQRWEEARTETTLKQLIAIVHSDPTPEDVAET
jgi:hypothetical protein